MLLPPRLLLLPRAGVRVADGELNDTEGPDEPRVEPAGVGSRFDRRADGAEAAAAADFFLPLFFACENEQSQNHRK